MRRIAFAEPALADIDGIIETSVRDFGVPAAIRYQDLIAAGVSAVASDDNDPGIRRSPETNGVLWYHLRSAKTHLPRSGRVARPRHIILFRVQEDVIMVLRVLHDAMDLSAHLR